MRNKLQIGFMVLLTYSIFNTTLAETSFYDTGKRLLNDTQITSIINARFARDNLVSVFDISTTTNKGVVSLKGKLNTLEEFDRAIVIALSVDGVEDIDISKLLLKRNAHSKQLLNDIFITARIKAKLYNNFITGIRVKTINGVAKIYGDIQSVKDYDLVLSIVQSISGVKEVENHLWTNEA